MREQNDWVYDKAKSERSDLLLRGGRRVQFRNLKLLRPDRRVAIKARSAGASTEHNAPCAILHRPPEAFPAVRETFGEVLAVDQAEGGSFGHEEGHAGVEGTSEEVDGKVVMKVLGGPELVDEENQPRLIGSGEASGLTIQKQ